MIEVGKQMKDMTGASFINQSYFDNLSQCEMTSHYIIDGDTRVLLEKALQLLFSTASEKLNKKDIGDLEKAHFAWEVYKSKQVMAGLGLI